MAIAMRHGIYTSERASDKTYISKVSSAVPFVVGIAPVNLLKNPESALNKPMQINNFQEAVELFGFEDAVPLKPNSDLKKYNYSLNEFVACNFKFYNKAPLILVNVLDPKKHKKTADTVTVQFDAENGQALLKEKGLLLSTIKITNPDTSQDYKQGKNKDEHDFFATFNEQGEVVLTAHSTGEKQFKVKTAQELTIAVEKIDPTAVTKDDIIGGIDNTTGKNKGLETINDVYNTLGLVPNIILAPNYSHDVEVAMVMAVKGLNINNMWNAIAVADIDSKTITKYTEVEKHKKDNNLVDENLVVCWPKVKTDKTIYNYSSHLFGVMAKADAQKDDIPCDSPSNYKIEITGICLDSGEEVILDRDRANVLNAVGVCTAINFEGWKAWGNRTACYPFNTDVKDNFINHRRMFFHLRNTFVKTFGRKVDRNIDKALINDIVKTYGNHLSYLVNTGYLAGGRIEFRDKDNPEEAIANGKLSFYISIAPFSPGEDISASFGLDTSYYQFQ